MQKPELLSYCSSELTKKISKKNVFKVPHLCFLEPKIVKIDNQMKFWIKIDKSK